jgi:hypothetical protein
MEYRKERDETPDRSEFLENGHREVASAANNCKHLKSLESLIQAFHLVFFCFFQTAVFKQIHSYALPFSNYKWGKHQIHTYGYKISIWQNKFTKYFCDPFP